MAMPICPPRHRTFCRPLERHTLLALLLGIAGCASPTTQWHTLRPPAAALESASSRLLLDVLPVRIPEALDRAQLVLRSPTGAGMSLSVLQQHQWVAPLQSELREAFSAALTPALQARDVHQSIPPEGAAVYRVAITVQRLDAVPGGESTLAIDWSVRPSVSADEGGTGALLSCRNGIRFATPGEPDGVVRTLGEAVQTLAATMATALHTLPRSQPCPANPSVQAAGPA